MALKKKIIIDDIVAKNDGTNAVRFTKADGTTAVLTIDTENGKVKLAASHVPSEDGDLVTKGYLDAQPAPSHTHGNIDFDGKIGDEANKPLITGAEGAIEAGAFGEEANTFCEGNDPRLSDAREASDVYAWAKEETLQAEDVPDLDAAKITSGVFDLARIPHAAIERLVVVADEQARFALTTEQVQKGDTVKQEDIGVMFFVVDDAQLDNEAGYVIYKAGSAASVPWSGVTDKPESFPAAPHDLASHTDVDGFSDADPEMNGVAAQGVSARVSRQDHVHPSDTSKANDDEVVKLAGDQTINGEKTFNGEILGTATTNEGAANKVVKTTADGSIVASASIKVSADAAAASAAKVGSLRYRDDASNSYVDMCMKIDEDTYAWVNIITNSW